MIWSAEFQKVLSVNPKNLKAQANLAVTFLSAKRYEDAVAALRAAIELSPADPHLRANLGIALEGKGLGMPPKLGRPSQRPRNEDLRWAILRRSPEIILDPFS